MPNTSMKRDNGDEVDVEWEVDEGPDESVGIFGYSIAVLRAYDGEKEIQLTEAEISRMETWLSENYEPDDSYLEDGP